MKKSLIIGIVGLAASAATTFGQGQISLSNYSTSLTGALQNVTYGAGSGGTVGTGVLLSGGFTAAFYIESVTGNNAASFNADGTGFADPASLYTGPGTFAAATGLGSSGGI